MTKIPILILYEMQFKDEISLSSIHKYINNNKKKRCINC